MDSINICVFLTVVVCALGAPQFPSESKVLGGENANPGEFPHMVSLRQNGGHFCGGSIISTTVILTASHCVVGTRPSAITVVSGTNKLNAGGNNHNVVEVITHENYNPADSWRNDVAILKLESPIVLSDIEQPIALPAQDENAGDDTGAPSRVSGWGYSKYPSAALPNDLQKVDLDLVPNDRCKAAFNGGVYPTHICAGTVNGEGVCNGDSGGPLLANGKQVGIVSWGRPCAIGIPDVYTRVASYADWIAEKSA